MGESSVGAERMRCQPADGWFGRDIHIQAFDLSPLGSGQRFRRNVQAEVAERIRLTGKAIALIEFALAESGFFIGRGLGHLPVDDLHLAAIAIAHAAANADEVNVQFAGAIQQGLVSRLKMPRRPMG